MRRSGLLGAARAASGFGRAALSLVRSPPADGEIPIPGLGGQTIGSGAKLRILSWNVQYCAGRNRRFFYDGGRDVSASPAEVETALAGVIGLIGSWDPDIVLLQEVDRDADRTGRVDQHERIGAALGFPTAISTPYHRVGWIPFPPHEHLGRVDMHLSLFSKFQALRAARRQLPLLRESWARQQFNLRRVLLEVDLATSTGTPLKVFDTHLSAFSFGDGSLAAQIARCADAAQAAETAGGRWLLAGDFNALPPGDDPARLGSDAALYPEADPPIATLTDNFASAGPGRSWVPWGSNCADRQLDWIFHGQRLTLLAHRVAPEGSRWSDHLPLITDFAVV